MTITWDDQFEQILRDLLPLPATGGLPADTCLREYGLTSLSTVELLMRLEDTYDISVPDELLTTDTFATPASLWRVVHRLRTAGAVR
jgi:acyl carrier protein